MTNTAKRMEAKIRETGALVRHEKWEAPVIVSDCKDEKLIRKLRRWGIKVVPWGPQHALWFWL